MTNYETRIQRVRESMAARSIGLLIVTPGAAMRYMTGFSEESHERLLALFIADGIDPFFVVPSLNATQTEKNPAGIIDVRAWDDSDGWEEIVRQFHYELDGDASTIAIDDDMPARFTLTFQELFPTSTFFSASGVVSPHRILKDDAEIQLLRTAAKLTDRAIDVGFSACAAGSSEMDVAFAIQKQFALDGLEHSFGTIVAAGPNGALPHHRTSETKLKSGDVVVLDFGAKYQGYCGDITRTIAVDHADDLAIHIYNIVYEAHQRGLESIKRGATAHDVDVAVRQTIVDAGYGEFFLHRTGHGIGIHVHEQPYIVSGATIELMPGHCFSLEPGIYLPGKFGVRLENIVTIADDGSPLVLNAPIAPAIPILKASDLQ